MKENLLTILVNGLQQMNMEVDEDTCSRLIDYVLLLNKWNRAYNLTAVRKPELMVVRHLLDSLVIKPYLKPGQVLDVGTGAGLPGIPLALVNPAQKFVLLDSNSKKTRFLTQAATELELNNVQVIHARVESYHPSQLFSTIMSRAYSTLNNMVTGTRHLLAEQGEFFAMKGVFPVAEVDELPAGICLADSHVLHVPELGADRHLLILKPC